MGLSNTAKGELRPVRNILEEKGLGINAQLESLNTERLYSKDRQPAVVVHRDGTTFTAVGPNGIIESGSNAQTVVQSAIDFAASSIPYKGTVFVRGGAYPLDSQLVVKKDTGLTTSRGALFYNNLSDKYKPCIDFKNKTKSHRIRVNAQGNSGIKIGEGTENSIQMGYVQVADVGSNKDGYDIQRGVLLNGYDINIQFIGLSGARIGVESEYATEVYIDSMIAYDCYKGLVIDHGGRLYFGHVNIDTPRGTGIAIDAADGIYLDGVVHAGDGTVLDNCGLRLGRYQAAEAVNMNLMHVTHGNTAVKVGKASGNLNFIVTNVSGQDSPAIIDTGIEYLDTYSRSNLNTNLTADRSLSTKVAGTPYGELNGTGYESAGSGNTPTASNWSVGQHVENTDDNTVWMKDATGTMRQVI